MKIDRLMGIVTILLQQDKVTAPELAERFEVSRRTINRDVEDICKAGIPLVTAQGRGGGISIADGYKMDKALFTGEELQAILTGLKGVDSISKTSYSARLGEKLSGKTNRVIFDDVILIDLASYAKTPLTHKIDVIKNAVRDHRLISFLYFYEKGECRRTIEPYRIVFRWSSWYVLGYCLQRKAFRLFKLNRLWDLETCHEGFEPRDLPPRELAFDEYFTEGKLHLKALFEEGEKYRLIEEYGIECYTVEEDHRLLLERDFASYKNMLEWILSFGDKTEVLEPEELRADVRRQAENILQREKIHDI